MNKMQKEVTYTVQKPTGHCQDIKYIRTKYVSEDLIAEWQQMIISGVKRKDICEQYGISMPTLRKYCGSKFKMGGHDLVSLVTKEVPQGSVKAPIQSQTNN